MLNQAKVLHDEKKKAKKNKCNKMHIQRSSEHVVKPAKHQQTSVRVPQKGRRVFSGGGGFRTAFY